MIQLEPMRIYYRMKTARPIRRISQVLHKQAARLLLAGFTCLLLVSCDIPGWQEGGLLDDPLTFFSAATPTRQQLVLPTLEIPPLPTAVTLEQEPFAPYGQVQYSRNITYPEQGCFWMGVVGQVFGIDGQPLEKYVLLVEGLVKDKPYYGLGLTGTTDAYGRHSYEVLIDYMPVNTTQSLSILLYDLDGVQLTNAMRFNTYADCTRNVIRIDFIQKP